MNIEWMDRLLEMVTTWFWLLMLATWRALPILILVTGFGLALRRKLSPSLHATLLTIVVIRLLLPISVGSPLSLHKPIDTWFANESRESVNGVPPKDLREYAFSILPSSNTIETRSPIESNRQPTRRVNGEWDLIVIAALAGMIGITVWLIIRSMYSHIRFARKLRFCRLLDDRRLIDLLLRECDSLAVGRRPVMREVPSLAAPAVFGLFRYTICFPSFLTEKLSDQELRWVIRHELAHVRRYDIPVAIIASVAGAVHWFNPLVRLIVRQLRQSMETAADRLALQNTTNCESAAYGDLLLRFAENSIAKKHLPTLGLITFASGKDLRQRVGLLVRERKPKGLALKTLSAVVVIAIAGTGLTDAMSFSNQELPEIHLIVSDATDLNVEPAWDDPWVTQENEGPSFIESYDATAIIQSLPESLLNSNKSVEEKLTSCAPLLRLKGRFHMVGTKLQADLTARQHQFLKKTLDIWKDGCPKQLTIETRFIKTNIHTASSIDWAANRIDGVTVRGLGTAIAASIDDPMLTRLVRTVSSDCQGNIMLGPKVTLFDGQTACIRDQIQRPFVTGVDSKPEGNLEPIVSVVDEGLNLVLTLTTAEDGNIDCDFKVKATCISKVSYANLPIRLSSNSDPQVTVQVPATEQYEVSFSAKLSSGESIVLAIPQVFDNKPGVDDTKTMIVALTPRILE